MNIHLLQEEINALNQRIYNCRNQLEKLPDGKLIITRNKKGNTKWYVNTNGHKSGTRYLHKLNHSDHIMAEQLARKKVLEFILKNSTEKQEILSSYVQLFQKSQKDGESILSDPELQKLLISCFQTQSEDLNKWASEEYSACNNHPENLKYQSLTGHVLRSKSEVIIDMALAMHQIPFRYEAPLTINGMTFFPDFTIRHPETGDYFYWEHFGMIDQSEYQNTHANKMRYYIRAGIVPTINLITTYETTDHPLSSQIVEKMIEIYLL